MPYQRHRYDAAKFPSYGRVFTVTFWVNVFETGDVAEYLIEDRRDKAGGRHVFTLQFHTSSGKLRLFSGSGSMYPTMDPEFPKGSVGSAPTRGPRAIFRHYAIVVDGERIVAYQDAAVMSNFTHPSHTFDYQASPEDYIALGHRA